MTNTIPQPTSSEYYAALNLYMAAKSAGWRHRLDLCRQRAVLRPGAGAIRPAGHHCGGKYTR